MGTIPKGVGSEKDEPLTPVTSPPTAFADELEPKQEAKTMQLIAAPTKSRLFVFILLLYSINLVS
jgi:hypothetical protein